MAPTGYTDGDGHLEAGLFKSTQGEKQTGYRDYSPLALKTKTKSNKMIYFRRALLVIVMGFVLGLGVATARPGLMNCQRHNEHSKMDLAKAHSSNGELAEALQKASPDLLHRLLHAYLPERYQHGVFATDKDAIDAISERDPSVASAIVQIAKRQDNGPSNNNSTTTAPTSTAPSSTAVQSSTNVQSSTASSAGSTTASETSSSKLFFYVSEALTIITNRGMKQAAPLALLLSPLPQLRLRLLLLRPPLQPQPLLRNNPPPQPLPAPQARPLLRLLLLLLQLLVRLLRKKRPLRLLPPLPLLLRRPPPLLVGCRQALLRLLPRLRQQLPLNLHPLPLHPLPFLHRLHRTRRRRQKPLLVCQICALSL